MKKLRISILAIMFFILTWCSGKEHWEGRVYPDKTKLLIHRDTGTFESLEACENASMEMLKSLDALEKGFYECGNDCKSASGYYYRVCDKTIRGNIYK